VTYRKRPREKGRALYLVQREIEREKRAFFLIGERRKKSPRGRGEKSFYSASPKEERAAKENSKRPSRREPLRGGPVFT